VMTGPCAGVVMLSGGLTQGWFNASFNLIINHAGNEWNGWIFAVCNRIRIRHVIALEKPCHFISHANRYIYL
jgi:hypothetical protein